MIVDSLSRRARCVLGYRIILDCSSALFAHRELLPYFKLFARGGAEVRCPLLCVGCIVVVLRGSWSKNMERVFEVRRDAMIMDMESAWRDEAGLIASVSLPALPVHQLFGGLARLLVALDMRRARAVRAGGIPIDAKGGADAALSPPRICPSAGGLRCVRWVGIRSER